MKFYAADKTTLQKWLAAPEENLADANVRIQEFGHNKETLVELPTRADEAEAKLRCAEKHVRFLEDKVSEQSNPLLEKDALSSGYRDRFVVLRQKLVGLSADANPLTAQYTAKEDLLRGIRTAIAIRMTALEKPVLELIKVHEKLLTDNVVTKTKLCKCRSDMQAMIDRIKPFSDGNLKLANALDSEGVRLPTFENSLKRHKQQKFDKSKEAEDLTYGLNRVIAKEHQYQATFGSLRKQLLSVLFDVNKYHQRFSLCHENFTADITNRLSKFPYNLPMEVKTLVEKQRKDIATTVKADLVVIDALSRSINSKLSSSQLSF